MSTTSRASVAHPHSLARRLLIVAIIVVLALAIVAALWPKAERVDVAIATTRAMTTVVKVDAVTRVVEHYTIAVPVTGLVHRLTLQEGQSIERGQVVAVVAVSPASPADQRVTTARRDGARAARVMASARVEQTTAALGQAERDVSRIRRLVEAGAMADRELEVAVVAVGSRRNDVEAARAQLRVADAELAQAAALADAQVGGPGVLTAVRAPASGRVLRIPERSARVVVAGTPLMEIGDPGTLEVTADVLSADAASICAGQDVTLTGWGGAPVRGIVRRVDPSARTRVSALGVEEQRLTVVIAPRDAPPALGDGFRLDASIAVWSAPAVLTVPASALLRDRERWQAWIMKDGRATRRVVVIGHLSGGTAEILKGVTKGDTVIVFAAESLHEGARVRSGAAAQ